ncbi:MAG: hypothetical protein ACTSWN_10235, partial [Promethearchaeota archaeon]
MKRLVQIIIGIVAFIVTSIVMEIVIGVVLGSNFPPNANIGNFPGQEGNYLDQYIGFLSQDTLGWFTYTVLCCAQSLDILGGVISFGNSHAVGLIPILMDYNYAAHGGIHTPVFKMFLMVLIRLIIPMFVVST